MKTIIVSGGTPPTYELLKEEVNNNSHLICADSGANCLYEYNIVPDLIVGDLDSINKDVLEYFKDKHVKIAEYPPEKDYTDTEIAIEIAIKSGAKEIVLLGSTGSRIDHMLGNLGLLLRCLRQGVPAIIRDECNTIMICDKSLTIKGVKGQTFSLQAYYNNLYNLTITGAKYPLKDFYLKVGDPITISNEFLDNEVTITFSKGIVLIIYPYEKKDM